MENKYLVTSNNNLHVIMYKYSTSNIIIDCHIIGIWSIQKFIVNNYYLQSSTNIAFSLIINNIYDQFFQWYQSVDTKKSHHH